jgi:glycyl-tRNA synthetase beta chain
MPRFAKDQLPETVLGKALSLADRLDTLAGIFAIGQRPTGVKDPFKLRRHALAVVRILESLAQRVDLDELLHLSLQGLPASIQYPATLADDLKTFILERLQSYYVGQGFAVETIMAVRGCQSVWVYDFQQRLLALQLFVNRPEMASLAAACKRVNNILAQAGENSHAINQQLLTQAEEIALVEAMTVANQQILDKGQDYVLILETLAGLRQVVDAFFDKVMVMAEDQALRTNRLHILARLQALLGTVADISQLSM